MNYAWASITQSTHNYGNFCIEWALGQILKLPPPAFEFDSFAPSDRALIDKINRNCDFVINPGCTTLQLGANAGFNNFNEVEVSKPCFGGCVWQMGSAAKWQLAVEALTSFKLTRRTRTARPSTVIAANMSAPVGARDPYTHDTLQAAGLESRFIGCPTLLNPEPLDRWRPTEGRRLTVSLGRFAVPLLLRILRQLKARWDITVLVHENYETHLLRLLPGVNVIHYNDPEQFFGHYRDADAVLTGRLHGALPSVRYGTPVVFFGDPADTRFSILSFLGLPIRPLDAQLEHFESFPEIERPAPEVYDRVAELRKAFREYCGEYGIETNLP